MAAVTICSDLWNQKKKKKNSLIVSIFSPSIFHEVMEPDAMIFVFWMWVLSQLFHSLLSLSWRGSFSYSLLSAIRVVVSVYLRLLIFLPAILIPAYASTNPAFLMMSSAYKVNKQGDNIQSWCIPFPIWNQSVYPWPVLTVAAWPACRFLRRQVRWFSSPISSRVFHGLLWSTELKAVT